MSNKPPEEITPLAEVPKFVGLTNAKAFEIGGALARLEELKTAGPKILAPGVVTNEDEAKNLVEYLANTLIQHGGELIGCFLVTKSEYNPLIAGLKPLFNRILATIAQDRAVATAKATKN